MDSAGDSTIEELISYQSISVLQVNMMTAASAPPAAVLAKMEALGVDVTHVYGLTEVLHSYLCESFKLL